MQHQALIGRSQPARDRRADPGAATSDDCCSHRRSFRALDPVTIGFPISNANRRQRGLQIGAAS
jgi:hypothetical protein